MNIYASSSIVAFILFGMGIVAFSLGLSNYKNNKDSKTGRLMHVLLTCVFLWDFGYAWMGLCFDSNLAYVARAIALLGVYLYAYYIIRYLAALISVPNKILIPYYISIAVAGVASWLKIIQKDAVSFQRTPWGYWYTSAMSWGRTLQFICILSAMVTFYIILTYGFKKATLQREKYIYKGYIWFGPILFLGLIFDTLIPSIFHSAAVPGSAVGAFFSTLLLHKLCKEYNAYGISAESISEYVFRDVHVPVIITDHHNQIALCNNYALKYFGFSQEDLSGENIKPYLQNKLEEYQQVVGKSIRDVKILSYESPTAGHIEFKLANTDVYDRFGELVYSIFFVQDVTTDQANLRSLEESRKIAEDANMAKSNFLANMSHEIRTPMNAIIGLSEIIIQNDPKNKSIETIQEIRGAANNLLGIINDILDISKIEAGKYDIIPDNYMLSSLVNDVCTIIRVRLQEAGIRFILKMDESLPEHLYGDVNRVRQILLNILGNAAKFTKQGSITLDITWNNDMSSPVLSFDVIDTGIGIKKEDTDSIFGAFNQVDTRRNRSVQGSGLGLAISRQLARLMDGDITVESVYEEGSTFHINIKQLIEDYKAIGPEICNALANNTYSTAMANASDIEILRPDTKVLIVDDVEMNLLIAQGLLQKYEINADIAISGKEALEYTKKTKYDLIFMDHMMPEMDGIDTTRAIRNQEDGLCKETSIIALTANALNEAKEIFAKEGLQDFLAKPIEPKLLDEIILKWT